MSGQTPKETLKALTEAALRLGGEYAAGAGAYLVDNTEKNNPLKALPPSAIIGFGAVAAAGILTTTVGVIREQSGEEDARKVLTTAMEVLCSMLNGPRMNLDVSIQVVVKEKPDDEAPHRG